MTTVKITDLPEIDTINSNTANTVLVGVDIPTNITGKMTLTTLAEGLYSNNVLTVGNTNLILANVLGQFTGSSEEYVQVSIQNLIGNGSTDLVATANNGTDESLFIDLGIAGSTYVYPGDTLNKPGDGYLIVVGDTPSTNGGNLSIGTITQGKNISFHQGNADEANVVGRFVYDTGFKLLKKPLYFADGTTQNTAVDYVTINSRITSNATSTTALLRGEIATNVATQNTFTQAAFNKANSALANTNGVATAGDFYVSGREIVNGTMLLANSNFSSSSAALTIRADSTTQTPSGDGYMLQVSGKQGIPSRIVSDSYNSYSSIAGRSARGTVTSPTPTQNNDVLMRIGGNGWGTTGFAPFSTSRIDFVAVENYTDSARGAKIVFYTTAPGSNVNTLIAEMNGDHVHFTGEIIPEKGFVYYPRVLNGAQTAITVDFSTDSMVRATFNDTLTLSFTGYQTGKVVEVWLTNTSGTGENLVHGCYANNSTIGSTSLNIASLRSVKLQYFSINSDLANTFVAVSYG